MPNELIRQTPYREAWVQFASAALTAVLNQPTPMNVNTEDYAHRAALLADAMLKELWERIP